jgi:hypothetical protein
LPQIERIRLTNVKYDNGKKEFVNDMFLPAGSNCAFILENGGGKSLMVQLLLQVVLPNESIGVRPASDLVSGSDRFTGHILVEWRLDDPESRYLLTGFCFTRGYEDERLFKYFMYTIQYDQIPNELDIENLPLLENRKVRSYQELLVMLRRLSGEGGRRLDVFQQDKGEKHKYVKHLETFNIYEREWRGIKTTNGDEGGMEGFFEKSKKTEQLMERLIIPGVDQVIFNRAGEEKELARAFTRHKDNLLSIPKLEKNIKDFSTIRGEGEKVLAAIKAYSDCILERSGQKEKVARLYCSVSNREEEINALNAGLSADLKKQGKWLHELEYKLDSLPYIRVKLELQDLEKKFIALTESITLVEKEARQSAYEVNLAKGKNLWLKIAAEQAKIKAARVEAENLTRSNRELMEQLLTCRYTWKTRLKERINRQMPGVKALREELLTLKSETKEKGVKQKRLEESIEKSGKQLGMVEGWLKFYSEKEKTLLAGGYEEAWVKDPAYGKKAVSEIMQEIKRAKDEIEDSIKKIVEELPPVEKEIEELKFRQASAANRMERINENRAVFNSQYEHIQDSLTRFSLDVGDIFANRADIETRLAQKVIEGQQAMLRVGAKKSNIQEKAELSGLEYYVPNRELLLVQEKLEEWGVFSETGSKWLDLAGISGQQRENYLKNNPLLPYSLIVARKDLANLSKLAEKWQKLALNNPVPLVVKSEAALSGGEVKDSALLPLMDNYVYLPWHGGYRYALSRQALEELRLSLGEQMEDAEQEISRLRQNSDLLAELEFKVREFYLSYPQDPTPVFESESNAVVAEMQKTASRLVYQEKRRIQKLEVKTVLEEDREKKGELLTQAKNHYKELENLYCQHEEKVSYLRQMEELAGQIQSLHTELADCRNRLNGLQTRITELTLRLDNESRILDEMERECEGLEVLEHDGWRQSHMITDKLLNMDGDNRRDSALPQVVAAVLPELRQALPLSYEEAKAQATGLEKTLAGEVKGLKSLEDDIKSCQEHIREYEKIIQNTYGLLLQEVSHADSYISNEVIGLLENRRESCKDMHRRMQKEQAGMNEQRAGAVSKMEIYCEEVAEKYGQEPYTLFSHPDNEEAVLRRDKLQVRNELQLLGDLLEKNNNELSLLKDARIRLDENMKSNSIMPIDDGLPPEVWQQAMQNVTDFVSRQTRLLNKLKDEEQSKSRVVEKQFEIFKKVLEARHNGIVNSFVKSLLEQDRHKYDFALVEPVFSKCFATILKYEESYKHKLKEIEEDKKELISRCIQQASRVADEINSIKKFSKFTLNDRNLQAIDIKLRSWEQQAAPVVTDNYINQCIMILNDMKDEGAEEQKLQEFIEHKMSSKELLNVLSPLSEAIVRVLKPEKDHASSRYDRWEGVFKWSGGERYAGFCAMYIALISYLRSKASAMYNPAKVLVADNPFGAASSPHILDMVFQLAAANRVQMICLTALTDQNIFKYFDVVYSLKLRSLGGKEFISVNRMDTGYYRSGVNED